MNDIVQIAPLSERVIVRGVEYQVNGLDIPDIAQLFHDFPELKELWDNRSFDIPKLLAMSKKTIAGVIAAALKVDAGWEGLALGEKAEILAKIVRLTAPSGIGPFVQLAEAIMPPAAEVSSLPLASH